MKHFRPRYSLLALLLFTAAVAGGVKLWRGPHHVVDRSNPQMEDEYTYHREWDGTKVVDGVRIRRFQGFVPGQDGGSILDHTTILFNFYRHGELLRLTHAFCVSHQAEDQEITIRPPQELLTEALPSFTPTEHEAYKQVIIEERSRYAKLRQDLFEVVD